MRSLPNTLIYLVIWITLVILTLTFITTFHVKNKSISSDKGIYRNSLRKDAEKIEQHINYLRGISQIAAESLQLQLNQPSGTARSEDATILMTGLLNKIAQIDNVKAAYYLDRSGTCRYSSRADFIGKNYGFRPYFKDSMAGTESLYIARGVTSGKNGIYYGRAVIKDSSKIGVLVIKIDPAYLGMSAALSVFQDHQPETGQLLYGIASTDNGILVDAHSDHLYSLADLSTQLKKTLTRNRQFPITAITSLNFPSDTWERLKGSPVLTDVRNAAGRSFHLFSRPLLGGKLYYLHVVDATWFQHAYQPVSSNLRALLKLLGIFTVLLIIFLFLLQRQNREIGQTANHLQKEIAENRARQKKFEKIINHTPAGFWVIDPETSCILEVNEALCEMLDRPAEELLGQQVTDILPRHALKEAIEQHDPFNSDHSCTLETSIPTREATLPVTIISSTFTEDGRSYRFAFLIDESQKRQHEEQLQLFSKAVEQSGSSIVITNPTGFIQYVNKQFCLNSGYSYEEAIGSHTRILQSGTHDRAFFQELWQTISSGQTWHGRIQNRRKDGSLFWEEMSISPIFDHNAHISHFIAIKEDITKRKALEEQLEETATELNLIIEYAGLAIAIFANHQVIRANSTALDMFGYTQEDVHRGLPSSKFFPDADTYNKRMAEIEACYTQGRIFQTDQLLRRADGTQFWCRITGNIIDKDHPERGAVWIVEDISQRKKMEAQMIEAKEAALAASRTKDAFIANLSHEIRTPLNGIIGILRLMVDMELDSELINMLRAAKSSGDHLQDLLNGLLDLSKMEAGQMTLEERPFKPRDIITQVRDMFQVQASDRNIQLKTHVSDLVPAQLIGDSLRIRQIITNLVGNAMKFTEQGTIAFGLDAELQSADTIRLIGVVQDTGIGIPADRLHTIFHSFSQAHDNRGPRFGGIGLGLNICKKLCHLMGGDITVSSTMGQGSRFTFNILCKTAVIRDNGPIRVEYGRADDTSQVSVLLVEDSRINRDVGRMTLEKTGCQTMTAIHGRNALEIMAANRFDLIFMDIQMPHLDGLTATRVIRHLEQDMHAPVDLDHVLLEHLQRFIRGTYTPIIALTANALPSDRRRCLESGMDDYLSKPLHPDTIVEVVDRFCQKKLAQPQKAKNRPSGKHPSSRLDLETVRTHLTELYSFDEDQINQLLASSRSQLQNTLRSLQAAARANDMEQLAEVAHKLKGSLLSFGLDHLANQARQIEKQAHAGTSGSFPDHLQNLQKAIKSLLDKMGQNSEHNR